MEIDIKHIAKLAKLSIPDDKVDKFQKEMSGIIDMVEQLPDISLDGALLDPEDTMELREVKLNPHHRETKCLLTHQEQPQAAY